MLLKRVFDLVVRIRPRLIPTENVLHVSDNQGGRYGGIISTHGLSRSPVPPTYPSSPSFSVAARSVWFSLLNTPQPDDPGPYDLDQELLSKLYEDLKYQTVGSGSASPHLVTSHEHGTVLVDRMRHGSGKTHRKFQDDQQALCAHCVLENTLTWHGAALSAGSSQHLVLTRAPRQTCFQFLTRHGCRC